MYTSKLFSHTHHNHFLTIYIIFYVICNVYLCVKMTVYSPSVHFFPSTQWESPWFAWGKRSVTWPQQFEISAFLCPLSNGAVWALAWPILWWQWALVAVLSMSPHMMPTQTVVTGITWTINYLWKTCLCRPSTCNAQLFSLVSSTEYLWCCLSLLPCRKCC